MPARLQTLGHLRLLDESGTEIAFPEKALLILCYLQSRGVADMPRAEAASLFWDDEHGAGAFANLRQTVSRVQKRQRELGRAYLPLKAISDRFMTARARMCLPIS
jgi:DNA-binding SARP family transcriptional activator